MPHNLNDQNYRRLFSSPHMVRALFDGILPATLREQIDLDTLNPLPSNFISGKNRDKRADCIWQVRRRDGETMYLLILLEHQSASDSMMSIRIMGYTALLYEDLVLRGIFKVSEKLPAILPIVLYSGAGRWRAPRQVSDVLGLAPAGLQQYQPQMRYLLLDEGLLVKKGNLPDKNLAALLFRLEHNQGLEQSREMLQTVFEFTRGSEFRELRRAFFLWVRHVLLPRSLPASIDLSSATNLSEIIAMLTTHTKDWGYYLRQEGIQEGEQKGWQKGRQEGRQEGLQQGAAGALSAQIAHKFGAIPDWAGARIQQANEEELKRWTLQILDAECIEGVFE